jgi:hypothetical protein
MADVDSPAMNQNRRPRSSALAPGAAARAAHPHEYVPDAQKSYVSAVM